MARPTIRNELQQLATEIGAKLERNRRAREARVNHDGQPLADNNAAHCYWLGAAEAELEHVMKILGELAERRRR